MSQRSIRRAQQRRVARERRRETLRRRRAVLAAGAAIGAAALMAPSAEANAPLVVNTTADTAPDPSPGACTTAVNGCTLREAVNDANATAGDDTITFDSAVTGTITLIQANALRIDPTTASDALTIDGPGRDTLSVSGSDVRRVVNIVSGTGQNTIRDLTLTHGYSSEDMTGGTGGGAVLTASGTKLALTDAAVTDSKTTDLDGGGGIFARGPLNVTHTTLSGDQAPAAEGGGINVKYSGSSTALTMSNSTVSGNTALGGGGIASYSGGAVIDNTTFSGNHATAAMDYGGGLRASGSLTLTHSTLTGNTSAGAGGGIAARAKYSSTVADSRISGNTAAQGGGASLSTKYGGAEQNFVRTTVSGNHAQAGAGVLVGSQDGGSSLTIFRSTISGNAGTGTSTGGGIAFGGGYGSGRQGGHFKLSDSTVSGNTATSGGGVALGTGAPNEKILEKTGSIAFDNSTIAANDATARGGGFYLNAYDTGSPPHKTSATVSLTSTIVGDNKAGGAPQDLDRANASQGGGFASAFSLIEAKGDGPVIEPQPGSSIFGLDPKLGPLANNGGPTLTRVPASTSPVIDKGVSPLDLAVDQRGDKRLVDSAGIDNPRRGDGTDIGAVELAHPPGDAKPVAVIKKNRLGAKTSKKRVASGRASDDHKVVRVDVALVRREGKRCRELGQLGHFGAKRKCGKPHSWLTASGRTKWKFALDGVRLKSGRYVLFARAVDNHGHVQTSFGKKSRRSFRVR
jgi:CSLREA domain-containing protein